VRHGETDWNRQSRIQGRTDVPLNAMGHRQSERVARGVGSHRVDRLITSPLMRARETMTHVCRALGRSPSAVEVAPAMIELAFGVWEGRTFHELSADPVYPKDLASHFRWRPEGGESHEDGVARVAEWIGTIREPTVIVAHGAIGRCLIGLLTSLAADELMGVPTPQGAYCKIENGRAEWFDPAAKASEKHLTPEPG
jgi:probable phosphoglycerate mutase